MREPVNERLAALASLDKAALCRVWKELYKAPPPHLRRDLMVRILGYRLQEQAYGSLSKRSVIRLREFATSVEEGKNRPAPRIKPGTRLVRQWQSETHVVHVEERGYEYRGSHYDSLSVIARLITGTRRSGPLFFGLKGKQAGIPKEAA